MNTFLSLAQARYSCRKFKDTPIEDDKLAFVLEAGRLAPTAKNIQPQRIYVIKSEEMLEKIRKNTPCAFNAPVVIAIGYDTDLQWEHPTTGYKSGEIDAAIVGTHMMMEAADLGLGTTWVGFFDAPKADVELGIPKGIKLVALLPIGYPDEAPSERHTQRRSPDELIKFI